jgi:hypothetical protein
MCFDGEFGGIVILTIRKEMGKIWDLEVHTKELMTEYTAVVIHDA